MTELIGLGIQALLNKGEIEQVVDLVKPVLQQYLRVEPALTPRVRTLAAKFFPDMQTDIAKAGVFLVETDQVQQWLNVLLGGQLVVDGVYGDGTKAAVRDFQTKHGLVSDGWVGVKTLVKLCAEVDKVS